MNKTVTFDFDNTLVMSYMDIESDDLEYKFQEYNEEMIKVLMSHIHRGDDVHIVTSRHEKKEGMFPNDTVYRHLKKLQLSPLLWPDKVHYTNGKPKISVLKKLGSVLHYDDDVEEHLSNFGKIETKNPLDFYEDSDIVTKVLILDNSDRILLLKRGDVDKKWDLPGGHIKQLEVDRGPQGFLDGLEREVVEETGILLPFAEKLGNVDIVWNDVKSFVHIYVAKLDQTQPNVNLDMQDFRENEEYQWVSMDEMDHYLFNSTKILKESINMLKNKGLLTEKEAWYLRKSRSDVKNRKKLIGLGDNKHTGGGKGHSRPSMKSPKSAPAGVGVLEEENEVKNDKIKVKITPKEEKIAEKRKKTRKKAPVKRRKTPQKRRNKGSNWPYVGGNSSDSGDSGGSGDGGGGGE